MKTEIKSNTELEIEKKFKETFDKHGPYTSEDIDYACCAFTVSCFYSILNAPPEQQTQLVQQMIFELYKNIKVYEDKYKVSEKSSIILVH